MTCIDTDIIDESESTALLEPEEIIFIIVGVLMVIFFVYLFITA